MIFTPPPTPCFCLWLSCSLLLLIWFPTNLHSLKYTPNFKAQSTFHSLLEKVDHIIYHTNWDTLERGGGLSKDNSHELGLFLANWDIESLFLSLFLVVLFTKDLSLLMNLFISLMGHISFVLVFWVQISVSALLNYKFLESRFTVFIHLPFPEHLAQGSAYNKYSIVNWRRESGRWKNTNTAILRLLKASYRIE